MQKVLFILLQDASVLLLQEIKFCLQLPLDLALSDVLGLHGAQLLEEAVNLVGVLCDELLHLCSLAG